MEIKATLKKAPIGRLKVLPLVNLIRGKKTGEVLQILSVQDKKAGPILYKLVQSAIANAEQKKTIDVDRLFVKEVYVNLGSHRKMWMPRARGSASGILKKSSHISVVLGER